MIRKASVVPKVYEVSWYIAKKYSSRRFHDKTLTKKDSVLFSELSNHKYITEKVNHPVASKKIQYKYSKAVLSKNENFLTKKQQISISRNNLQQQVPQVIYLITFFISQRSIYIQFLSLHQAMSSKQKQKKERKLVIGKIFYYFIKLFSFNTEEKFCFLKGTKSFFMPSRTIVISSSEWRKYYDITRIFLR